MKVLILGLLSTEHAHTRAQTPCRRADIWGVSSYSIRSIGQNLPKKAPKGIHKNNTSENANASIQAQ